jgi:hypothetical protein
MLGRVHERHEPARERVVCGVRAGAVSFGEQPVQLMVGVRQGLADGHAARPQTYARARYEECFDSAATRGKVAYAAVDEVGAREVCERSLHEAEDNRQILPSSFRE